MVEVIPRSITKKNVLEGGIPKAESIVVEIYAAFASTDPAPPYTSDTVTCATFTSAPTKYKAAAMEVQKIRKCKRKE